MMVDVGASHQLRGVRLLAERVPDSVTLKRQERLRETAITQQKPVNPLTWELAAWTLVVTSVPASMLTMDEAFVLLRARWQIELLFKLWKDRCLLDEWQSVKPWRILAPVYAPIVGDRRATLAASPFAVSMILITVLPLFLRLYVIKSPSSF
jgi:hypothetical protein